MSGRREQGRETVAALRERAAELDCLYTIERRLKDIDVPPESVLEDMAQAIPSGWRRPECCHARITLGAAAFQSQGFQGVVCLHRVDILVENEPVGVIEVYGQERTLQTDTPAWSAEKDRLIDNIAERVGQYLRLRQLRHGSTVHARAGRDPIVRRDGEGPGTLQSPVSRHIEYRGLCMTCVHSSRCAFPRREGRPVSSCEEFDDRGRGGAEAMPRVTHPVDVPAPPATAAGQPRLGLVGLCATCEHRDTCNFHKPEGGIWHCEEFA